MVSQVICMICSVSPEAHTTEITFHKFPCPERSPNVFKAWKDALDGIVLKSSNNFQLESSVVDTYVCSRHFTFTDFAFDNGKLLLVKDAVPTLITEDQYDTTKSNSSDRIIAAKMIQEYEPSFNGSNFASTVTNDFVTTSSYNFRSALISTETSRALTPNAIESITTTRSPLDMSLTTGQIVHATNKRNADLEHKIQDFRKIFKRLRTDNLLSDTYVEELKVGELWAVQFTNDNFILSFHIFRNKYQKLMNYSKKCSTIRAPLTQAIELKAKSPKHIFAKSLTHN